MGISGTKLTNLVPSGILVLGARPPLRPQSVAGEAAPRGLSMDVIGVVLAFVQVVLALLLWVIDRRKHG